jgi:hypothetical protein
LAAASRLSCSRAAAPRRPAAKADSGDTARDAIRSADVLAYLDVVTEGAEEFVLLVARREPNGTLAVIAPVAHDAVLVEKAIRKSEI